jgi:hypothetical protein
MEWLLAAPLFVFALLAKLIKPLYDKWYDSGVIVARGSYDPRFESYLQRIAHEATIRSDWEQYSARGYAMHHFDRPRIWQKELLSQKERLVRSVSSGLFIAYVIVIVFFLWSAVSYHFRVDDFRGAVRFLSGFSVVAVLYWRHKRSLNDGVLQGYLNGYSDALERPSSRASIRHDEQHP